MASIHQAKVLEEASHLFTGLLTRDRDAQAKGHPLHLEDAVMDTLNSHRYDAAMQEALKQLLMDVTVTVYRYGLFERVSGAETAPPDQAGRYDEYDEPLGEIITNAYGKIASYNADMEAEARLDIYSGLHALSVVTADGCREWHLRQIGQPNLVDGQLPALCDVLDGGMDLHENTTAPYIAEMQYAVKALFQGVEAHAARKK